MRKIYVAAVTAFLLFSTNAAALSLAEGVEAWQDGEFKTALIVFEPMARSGDALAQDTVGWIYYDGGGGVEQNYTTAAKWFELAASQGRVSSQAALGAMYYNGQGLPKDFKSAFHWYKRAAEQGEPSAQRNLANLYTKGLGTIQDYVVAHMWLNIMISGQPGEIDKFHMAATAQRALLQVEMTPSQIAEAQKLARECIRKNLLRC